MNRRAVATVIAIVFVCVGLNWSRFSRNTGELALLSDLATVWVQLGDGFTDPGIVCQFNDDCGLGGVIELTSFSVSASALERIPRNTAVESGRRIDLVVQGAEIQSIYFTWMTAGQRVALGIPLHPDRMTLSDWEFLPGVGPKVAAKIEENRQKDGDFYSLEGLIRVKGVGSSKIADWMKYFK